MPKPKIAKEDIVVYKFGIRENGSFILKSPFFYHSYEIGRKYNEPNGIVIDYSENIYGRIDYSSLSVGAGFHAITSFNECKKRIINVFDVFERGLTANEEIAICRFTIPKGATYIYGENNEIVSDEIIFDNFIESYV